MKKLQFDLILATDENNLLKDKHQTDKEYREVKTKAYHRVMKVLNTIPKPRFIEYGE